MSRFLERLASGPPIVADGGMGALLASAVDRLRCPEEANLKAPEAVIDVHLGYIRAGAELIETNTFGANRAKLAQHFLEDEFEQINAAAVKLAREAREISGKEVFIAGSIGPGGDYAEQALVLEGRGVDLFFVETFADLDDLEAAVAAVRSVSSLPIVALMSFDSAGDTLAGVSAAQAAARLRALDVAAFGANHGAGPTAALRALAEMQVGAPLAVLPNVGLASMSGRRIVFPHATPEYFAEFAAQARALGARIIGGCCGTTPAQIAAISHGDHDERGAGGAAARARARAGDSRCGGRGADEAPAAARGRHVRRLRAARPAARREPGGADRDRARGARLGQGAVRRRERQPARARAHERDHGVGRDRALHRRRDDPAPDAARHDDRRPRVAAARRARRGRAQHPLGDRRSARVRRLSRRARRLRGRLDRARRADGAPEPRRGLPRSRDRRTDVVLSRRRRQPDRRRPRARGRAASSARSRRARASR